MPVLVDARHNDVVRRWNYGNYWISGGRLTKRLSEQSASTGINVRSTWCYVYWLTIKFSGLGQESSLRLQQKTVELQFS